MAMGRREVPEFSLGRKSTLKCDCRLPSSHEMSSGKTWPVALMILVSKVCIYELMSILR